MKDTAPILIELRGVKKAYHTHAGEFLALKGIDADLHAGEYVGILGKSGAGKTTLMNMISGTDRLTAGSVRVGGVSVHDLNESERALWRGRSLGVVYQSFYLMPTLTLLDNVLLPMDLCGTFQGRRSVQRAYELLEAVELTDHAHKLPSAISGGQQQRVAIARALANDPPLLVADEPTGRLDILTAEVIYRIFERLVQQGKTVVVVSHDDSLDDRVSHLLRLQDGQVVEEVRRASIGSVLAQERAGTEGRCNQ